ncbi:hypothetical protein QPK32_21240 [Massilia sp. YIM B02763]|uniref:hypothetical protein n=1 Tax=Massilia sp. YIM B02763 TaxID=3050130 RepID=UPI0025B68342|nr:hypothetical protein [Massilia sp. YIM B02763]MDN4055599.1 hypothetical protein [Massilia sp. YIM B02763]
MKLFASAFPRGAAGIGLLLLRATTAYQLAGSGIAAPPPLALALACGATALLLATGFLTPLAAASCLACELLCFALGTAQDVGSLVDPILCCLAVGLAGPGAYSLDARLFGRRRVLADIRTHRKH